MFVAHSRMECAVGGRRNMNDRMPCFTDCDDNRLPADNLDRARAVEDYADNLMTECLTLAGADRINQANDLYDGVLLPQMMQLIALWMGSTVSAAQQMRQLHNLLANALQTIAEKEVK